MIPSPEDGAVLALMCVMACAWAQAPETTEASTTSTTTFVPILRQVNEVNEDGTYTYGFEAADGTFKLETRDEEGNVKGKYGFLNEFGELKTVEYSAGNETGFVPTSDLLPKSVPVPAVPAVPTVPQRQASNPIVPQLPQLASLPLLHRPQQFRTAAQATQRPFNIELDGFSEDRNEDGFVDGSPEEAAKGNPVAPSFTPFLPAGTSSLPAVPAVQPLAQPQLVPQQTPQSFHTFVPGQPQLTAQQIQQQQQFLAGQQRFVPQQFAGPLSVPQQFVPQQFPAQPFLPQQFAGQPFVPQQPVGQRAFPHQFIPQPFPQFQQLRPVAPPQPVITKA
ncbi:actin cytoskeleton-regulatory complex protein pan1-like [Penaeus chinensis]|uniref:actin cytoskeleton-regulatory complex protein pan1-like n=1 Tax=Penaeus chinensis TaxID=139456 RepID=UPI001FB5A819|nr:actin cytoskeleton-regulatory complex protein pan1-like [Penaeus chinensis]